MVNIIKQEIVIEKSLKKKLELICEFSNTTLKIINAKSCGIIIHRGDIVIGVKCIIYEKNNRSLVININNEESKIQNNDISKSIDNKLVFKYLDSLYRIIDGWQKEYIDTRIIDGDSWKLSITYINGSRREYYGKSSYPTNFEALERLNQKLIDEVQNG